ncbi:MAG: lipopolysaccharide biosynthesis protein [Deltaproteobacteria bacterium]|nr:lipopolysaccharide biosynthesis protein [Deltaproteobacteria bacterium]TLN01484.1 MAG: lipopolysaccharide biosynthesis protein [bacterium]
MQDKEALHPQDDESINLLDYLQIIAKRSRMIFGMTFAAFVASIIISLVLPKIYSSTARILPPQQDQGLMTAMMSQMGGLANLAGGMFGGGTSGDMYVGILNSEAVKDAIIDRFKLMDVYEQKFRLDTYRVLDKTATIELGKKDGIISITVEDKDPKRAANMANAFVDELGKLTVNLSITGAGRNRIYLEERLAKAKIDLVKAENDLSAFQAKNKFLDVAGQAQATIESVAQLKAQLAVKEVQLAALRAYITDDNDEIRAVKASIENLTKQISRLEGSSKGSSIPGVGAIPALGKEYLRFMREFKIQESIVELLTKQHELAKLSEAKDVPGIQIIQNARVPDKKVKPKRTQMVVAITFVAFVLTIILSFFLEYLGKMPDNERSRLLEFRRMFLARK